MQWNNYLVPSVKTPLTKNHLAASELLQAIDKMAGSEGYHNLFDVEPRDTYEGYKGKNRPVLGFFWLDFDGPKAKSDVTKLVTTLKDKGVLDTNIKIYFSGNKGFHVALDERLFNIPHDEKCADKYKEIALEFKNKLGLESLDSAIVQGNRKFRAPNSKHQKTGLHKIEIPMAEWLGGITLEQVKAKATLPAPHSLADKVETVTPFDIKLISYQSFGYENIVASDQTGNVLVSKLKAYDKKLCVKSLFDTPPSVGDRHNALMILTDDLYNTGVSESEALKRLGEWGVKAGLVAEKREGEIEETVHSYYSGSKTPYDYSCVNQLKASRCSGKCGIYKLLSKEKRPQVIDAPKTTQKELTQEAVKEELSNDFYKTSFKIMHSTDGKHDFFTYDGKRWQLMSPAQENDMKKRLFKKFGCFDYKTFADAFKVFCLFSKPSDTDMFKKEPNYANFNNGTLWVTDQKDGGYKLEWIAGHRATDNLVSLIDANCPPIIEGVPQYKPNLLLIEYLNKTFEGDPDREGKIRALKQQAGAALMPCFPRLFFNLGAPATGKSTFAKLLRAAFGGDNYFASVEPKKMYDTFGMQSLILKTVNIHTDISEQNKIPDSFLKTVEDAIPVTVNRKFKSDIAAYLPFVHIFCANSMPPTSIKEQGVYDRRVTIVEFTNRVVGGLRNYENVIIHQGGIEGILGFALEGLIDLVNNKGEYFRPETSSKHTKDWQDAAKDEFQDFLDSVADGEVESEKVALRLGDDYKIERKSLYEIYKVWSDAYGDKYKTLTRNKFYGRMKGVKGVSFSLITYQGIRMFKGIGFNSTPIQSF